MDVVRIAALIAFVAVTGLVVYVVLRSRAVGRRSREGRIFADAVSALADRVLASLGGALSIVDDVRRHRADASTALPAVEQALGAIDGFVEDVRALPTARPPADPRAGLEGDLRRAERALDRARHGCHLLASAPGRGTEQEAQASVKRGYLELQHARDAFARRAAEAAQGATASATRR